MKVVRQGLYSKLTGDATLVALLASSASVYHAIAPDTAEFPYIIFHKQAGTPTYTFAENAWDEQVWLIKAVDRNTTSNKVDDIATRLEALLTDGTLTISGKTQMSLRRESDIEFTEVQGDQQYRHAGGLYRLALQ